MTFPDTALGHKIEIDVNSTWTDITSYNDYPPVVITRGHPDESATVAPSTVAFTLRNGDYRFTSLNPTGPYYPYLVRNVPGRVSVPAQVNYLRLEGDTASGVVCGDSVGVSITGDTEIQLDLQLTNWQPCVLAAKWNTSSDKTWALLLNDGGTLTLTYWDGSTVYASTSTAALPVKPGRFAVKVTLQLNNGASGHTVTFYTSTAIGGTWTILGSAVVTSGTITSLFDATAGVEVGYSVGYTQTDPHAGYNTGMNGRLFEFRLISGIGGTIKANPVFTAQPAGNTSFSDAEGNSWLFYNTSEISDRDYRCHAELAGWPQNQDETGKTVKVAVSGGGLLRRKGRQSTPLKSALTRYWERVAAPVAYWPMEDGSGATAVASGLGGPAMTVGGSPQFASSSAFAGSGALPALNFGILTGAVSGDSVSELGASAVVFLLQVPSGGDTNLSTVCTVSYDNQPDTVTLTYTTAANGTLSVTGYFAGGTIFSGTVATGVNGQALAVMLSVYQISVGGATCGYQAQVLKPGSNSPSGASGTYSGGTGQVTQVKFNDGGFLSGTVVGQCAVLGQVPVWSPVTAPLTALNSYLCPDGSYTGPLAAWKGEPAGIRFGRLCSEEAVQFRGIGSMFTTVQMGSQGLSSLTTLLQECADTDRGVWYEPRQCLGWGYAARNALYNQSSQVTVSYGSDHLSMWGSDPLEDDQYVINDVTCQNSSTGSSARAYAAAGQAITGGRLATTSIGTYDTSVSVNAYKDSDLPSRAAWELHLGTVDEPRFPGIVLDLSNRALASLYWNILGLDLGQPVEVDSPPGYLPPDPVKQIAAQLTETLGPFQLEIAVCGIPERPYEVAVIGTSHLDTDGTALNAGVSSGATSESFDTSGGTTLWSVSGGDYPCDVMVAGERQTVTAMTGGSTPQTATVTRSANGVVKAQAGGAAVNVYPSPVLAL